MPGDECIERLSELDFRDVGVEFGAKMVRGKDFVFNQECKYLVVVPNFLIWKLEAPRLRLSYSNGDRCIVLLCVQQLLLYTVALDLHGDHALHCDYDPSLLLEL